MGEGDFELALQLYTDALAPQTPPGADAPSLLTDEAAAVLYNNRALANIKLRRCKTTHHCCQGTVVGPTPPLPSRGRGLRGCFKQQGGLRKYKTKR